MDNESLKTIIIILSGAFLVAGGALIAVVSWVVMKTFSQNEDIKVAQAKQSEELKAAVQAEFKQFGQQLAAVKELLKDEIHALALRVTTLEEWRKATEAQPKKS